MKTHKDYKKELPFSCEMELLLGIVAKKSRALWNSLVFLWQKWYNSCKIGVVCPLEIPKEMI